ncbi:MAG: hypothetical protein EZS28_033643 [Streblomastix strix]|uniref:Uncharacterized protein n=1 Tax=Streblomastix strix TaxID=222440 RepID=A0A5J4ULD4_9EUKA|nr:MAG: hypothetical protein EZS28_033643 [Streblomastix strix]
MSLFGAQDIGGLIQQKNSSLFGQNTGGLFGAQNHGGLWGRQTPGGMFGSEPLQFEPIQKPKKYEKVRVMKKRLLEEKNRFSSLFALNSSQSENGLLMENIQKHQWNLEKIKSFEQQIESDSDVAIKAVNEGLISDIVSNALSSNNKREIQFKSWILLQQILEIWHNQKQDQINIETKENKESDENKNEDSQMFHMPKDFATGLVILSGTEDISIGAQIFSGIKFTINLIRNKRKNCI